MNYPRYICTICCYLFETDPESGDPRDIAFEQLPEDWSCPSCSSPKEMFQGCTCKHYDIYEQTLVRKEACSGDENKHVCTACDYIWDKKDGGVKFQNLPDSWTCPSCGAQKDLFQPCSCVRITRSPDSTSRQAA